MSYAWVISEFSYILGNTVLEKIQGKIQIQIRLFIVSNFEQKFWKR